MHRIDFDMTSEISQTFLRNQLASHVPTGDWRGRESEYMGVYTMARFDNMTLVKIFQPNEGNRFDVEISAPDDVPSDWLDDIKARIIASFDDQPS